MADRFKGVVNIDIKDSTPDWVPYTQPIAPPDAPTVVEVVRRFAEVRTAAPGCRPAGDEGSHLLGRRGGAAHVTLDAQRQGGQLLVADAPPELPRGLKHAGRRPAQGQLPGRPALHCESP